MKTFIDLESRYVLAGVLRAEQALHIGTGAAGATTDAPVARQGGDVYLPGSSLRGVLRSTAERLSRAIWGPRSCCVLFEDDEENWCWAGNPKLRKAMEEAQGGVYDKKRQEMVETNCLCPVCQLFGCVLMGARLKIADAPLKDKGVTARRDGVGIDRDSGTAAPRIKYDFEVVERGASFDFELHLENASATDFGLLCILLGELERGIEVGGKKTRGIGRVRLDDYKVSYFESPAGLKEYLLGKPAVLGKTEFGARIEKRFREQTGAWIPAGKG